MNKDFLIIGITLPHFYKNEEDIIMNILSKKDVSFVHIRKPYVSKEELKKLINKIDRKWHKQLKLHDHFDLLNEFTLGGIHLNSRNPEYSSGDVAVSKSIHSLEEIESCDQLDYFFFSPVFDSISKPGYKGKIDLTSISEIIRGKRAIALGGVTPEKYAILKKYGFYGAALSGYFFKS